MNDRLALGTAQFGLAYGVANCGQVSGDEVGAILSHAWAEGIDTIDTAVAYGDAEQRLGERGVGQWRIVSKLPAVPDGVTGVGAWVRKSAEASLERLGVPRLGALLLHHPADLSGRHGGEIRRALDSLKADGLIEKTGVSVYSPEDLDAIWPELRPDLVQAPFNVLDRRLVSSGWLARLGDAGVEVHVRSVFLQGLLLLDDGLRPPAFNRWRPLWMRWRDWLEAEMLTPLQGCLGFALSHSEIDRVVIGVESVGQLREILSAAAHECVLPPVDLVSADMDLIDPRRWGPEI